MPTALSLYRRLFFKACAGTGTHMLIQRYACKESGFEPYKSSRDQGRMLVGEVMLIRSMLIKRVECNITDRDL